jgi:hypothetical protein
MCLRDQVVRLDFLSGTASRSERRPVLGRAAFSALVQPAQLMLNGVVRHETLAENRPANNVGCWSGWRTTTPAEMGGQRAGQMVTTESCSGTDLAQSGTQVEAEFSGIGEIAIHIVWWRTTDEDRGAADRADDAETQLRLEASYVMHELFEASDHHTLVEQVARNIWAIVTGGGLGASKEIISSFVTPKAPPPTGSAQMQSISSWREAGEFASPTRPNCWPKTSPISVWP